MQELTITEAASALSVSVDTIRRRCRDGRLLSRRDSRGRLIVLVDVDERPIVIDPELERLRAEVRRLEEVNGALRRLADSQQEALKRREDAEHELRALLGMAHQQVQRLLPPGRDDDHAPEAKRRRWWPWRR